MWSRHRKDNGLLAARMPWYGCRICRICRMLSSFEQCQLPLRNSPWAICVVQKLAVLPYSIVEICLCLVAASVSITLVGSYNYNLIGSLLCWSLLLVYGSRAPTNRAGREFKKNGMQAEPWHSHFQCILWPWKWNTMTVCIVSWTDCCMLLRTQGLQE